MKNRYWRDFAFYFCLWASWTYLIGTFVERAA